MHVSRSARQWSALALLATTAAAVLWLLTVQAFLVAMSPTGGWSLPRVRRVTVLSVDRDPDSQLTDNVSVTEESSEQVLRMLKAEARELRRGDEPWILENYFQGGLRPDHFRLTPARVLLEYPEPILLLALWGIVRIRKAQARDAKRELARPRKVWTDEFHKRAERFRGKDEGPPAGPE